MFTLRGNLVLENITLDGNGDAVRTVTENGAIIQFKDNSTGNNASLTIGENASLINGCTSGNGGAVWAEKSGQTITINGGTISGCTAAKGAGVYAGKGVTVNLSGGFSFGGTDQAEGSHILFSDTTHYVYTAEAANRPKNGGTAYPVEGGKYKIRQDIYLAGTDSPLTTLQVTGKLTDPEDAAKVMPAGSIWVWAENQNHYEADKQFAVVAADYTPSAVEMEEVLKAFRNAQADSITKNPNSSHYLYGIKGDGVQVVWGTDPMGSRRVILRKVDETYGTVQNAEFTVYRGSSIVSVDGKELKDLKSGTGGAFWIGTLPYGTYYLHETTVPNGYQKLSDNDNWYILTVNEDGCGYKKQDSDLLRKRVEPEEADPNAAGT